MAQIVIFHGIGKQYRGPSMLQSVLAPAVVDGVHLAGGKQLSVDDVRVAFYGDWFRRPGAKGSDFVSADELTDPYEVELLLALWAGAAQTEPDRVPAPNAGGKKLPVPVSVQRALDALSRSRFLAGQADTFLLGVLRQVRRYLTEPTTRVEVQRRVTDCVGEDTRVVIGHSLGSVVAYEALCRHREWPVGGFVTLGSPLGIRNMVFDRLLPAPESGRGAWPTSVESWTNVCDRRDVVALVKRLSPLFGSGGGSQCVVDEVVDNGWKAHDLTRHLTAVETGRAVARSLEG